MTNLQETFSSLLYEVCEEEYCRRVFREKYTASLKLEGAQEETSVRAGYPEAYKLAMAEEQVCNSLWSNITIRSRELEPMVSLSWKGIVPTLRSSRRFSTDQTALIGNKLNQVWLLYVVGLKIADVNQIHRNLIFDISSYDAVEDFLRVELPIEFLKIPSRILPQITPEIIEFCSRERITSYLPTAVNSAEKNFPTMSELKIETEQDPETEEEWLVLNVTIRGEVDEVLNNYDKYINYWVSTVPWPERQKIRLLYNII
jgi:hypothetical protein